MFGILKLINNPRLINDSIGNIAILFILVNNNNIRVHQPGSICAFYFCSVGNFLCQYLSIKFYYNFHSF